MDGSGYENKDLFARSTFSSELDLNLAGGFNTVNILDTGIIC